jgi:hypothetical protein
MATDQLPIAGTPGGSKSGEFAAFGVVVVVRCDTRVAAPEDSDAVPRNAPKFRTRWLGWADRSRTRQAGCSVVDRPTNGLRGAHDGEHAGELPGPRPPSGQLPFEERFPYSLSADEYQHEGRGVGRDVCVDVTCARRVEGQ